MRDATAAGRRLVIRLDSPRAVQTLLAPLTQQFLWFLPADDRPSSPDACGVPRRDIPGTSVFDIPLDGPMRALSVALRAIRAHAPPTNDVVVIPVHPDHSPPPIGALLEIARVGLTAGVDLGQVRWVAHDGFWWTDEAGPVRLPLDVAAASDARRSAVILTATRGFDPNSPVGRWVEAQSRESAAASVADWSFALAARFIEVAVGVLSAATLQQDGVDVVRSSSTFASGHPGGAHEPSRQSN